MEWGRHIHTVYKDQINAVLQIPQTLRTAWGMYKNLLAGVTTVVNHGALLHVENPLLTVYQQTQNLHSVQFQKKWKWHLNNPVLKNSTCVIHTGEGSDQQSSAEIDALLQWNLLKRKLIGIHAVAMNPAQAKKFAGLVWCPESNRVLLNHHAAVPALKAMTTLVFGTDSTLTGNWNIWQHLRLARKLALVSDDELFAMTSSAAATLWGIDTGELQAGKDADIIIAKTASGRASWNDVFGINPECMLLVLHKGNIRLFDGSLLPQLSNGQVDLNDFSRISINGKMKWVQGNLPALINRIKTYHPAVQLPKEIVITGKSCCYD
jgi:hypothetical protein